MQTKERKKANLGNKSRFNITTRKSERKKRNKRDNFNSPAGVAGAKRKQRKGETMIISEIICSSILSLDSSTSTDSSMNVDLSSGKRKRMKNVKRSTSTKSKQKEPKGKIFHNTYVTICQQTFVIFFSCLKGNNRERSTGAQKKKPNNR